MKSPGTCKQEMSGKNSVSLKAACDDEMMSMNQLNFYNLVTTPSDRKNIENKWVFKVKEDEFGNVAKFKARWVMKGFIQTQGVDYDVTHESVSRMYTLR